MILCHMAAVNVCSFLPGGPQDAGSVVRLRPSIVAHDRKRYPRPEGDDRGAVDDDLNVADVVPEDVVRGIVSEGCG